LAPTAEYPAVSWPLLVGDEGAIAVEVEGRWYEQLLLELHVNYPSRLNQDEWAAFGNQIRNASHVAHAPPAATRALATPSGWS
jgi:hypothetical protein